MGKTEKYISINKIKILRNTRQGFGDVSDLMASIRENGLLHNIGVCKSNNEYILIYGHRRFEALKKLGRKSLEIGKEIKIIEKDTDADLLVLNIVENYHIKGNTPLEFAKACSDLKELGFSIGEIAVRLSVPKSRITTALLLLKDIPEKRRKDVSYVYGSSSKKGKISATVSSSIAYIKRRYMVSLKDIDRLFDIAKDKELSTKDLRLIGVMMKGGKSLNETIKDREKYVIKQVDFVVDKEKLKQLNQPFSKYVKEVLIGKKQINKKLIY